MRILFRYVFREFLIPLCYCLAGFLGIYVLFELFGSYARIAEAKLPFGTILQYFAGYLSPYFLYLAPAALMLATLYTMWNFCRHSELTAMRASGISLLTIVKPLMLAACLLAGFVCWVNECYVPTHALWAKRLRAAHFDLEEARRQGVLTFKDTEHGHSWLAESYDATCCHLEGVRLKLVDAKTGHVREVSAGQADYLDGEWWLTGEAGKPVEVSHSWVDADQAEAAAARRSDKKPVELTLRCFPELREKPGDLLMQSDGPQLASARSKLRYLQKNDDLTDASRNSWRYDAWAQLLSPLACIVITLLTIPAGISTGRQAVFNGVLGALFMFFAYYGMTIGCMVLAKTGLVPPVLAAFAPLVIFLALGVFFCRRPLYLTLRLLVIFAFLFALYVVLAYGLTAKLGMPGVLAHTLALTLPLTGAGFCFVRLRPA